MLLWIYRWLAAIAFVISLGLITIVTGRDVVTELLNFMSV